MVLHKNGAFGFHVKGCNTNIIITRKLTAYRQLDSIVAGQVKQKRVCVGGRAGAACTDAHAFKGRMGNSEMQIGQILISARNALQVNKKRNKQLKPFCFIFLSGCWTLLRVRAQLSQGCRPLNDASLLHKRRSQEKPNRVNIKTVTETTASDIAGTFNKLCGIQTFCV